MIGYGSVCVMIFLALVTFGSNRFPLIRLFRHSWRIRNLPHQTVVNGRLMDWWMTSSPFSIRFVVKVKFMFKQYSREEWVGRDREKMHTWFYQFSPSLFSLFPSLLNWSFSFFFLSLYVSNYFSTCVSVCPFSISLSISLFVFLFISRWLGEQQPIYIWRVCMSICVWKVERENERERHRER